MFSTFTVDYLDDMLFLIKLSEIVQCGNMFSDFSVQATKFSRKYCIGAPLDRVRVLVKFGSFFDSGSGHLKNSGSRSSVEIVEFQKNVYCSTLNYRRHRTLDVTLNQKYAKIAYLKEFFTESSLLFRRHSTTTRQVWRSGSFGQFGARNWSQSRFVARTPRRLRSVLRRPVSRDRGFFFDR